MQSRVQDVSAEGDAAAPPETRVGVGVRIGRQLGRNCSERAAGAPEHVAADGQRVGVLEVHPRAAGVVDRVADEREAVRVAAPDSRLVVPFDAVAGDRERRDRLLGVDAAVLRQVDEDAARRGRIASAPEADEREVAAEEVLAAAQVEQRARRGVAPELEHGARAVVLVRGGRIALDAAHAVRHGEAADGETALGDEDGPARRRGRGERGPDGLGAVGRAVYDGAVVGDVDHGSGVRVEGEGHASRLQGGRGPRRTGGRGP